MTEKRKKAYVLDDSNLARKSLSKFLGALDFEVVDSNDGTKVLSFCGEDTSVDLFMVDLNMPIIGGIEFIQRLRKIEHYETTPVVVLTSETNARFRELARDAGATAFMTKSYTDENMRMVLQEVMTATD